MFHVLIYSPNACNSQCWARLKSGARNSLWSSTWIWGCSPWAINYLLPQGVSMNQAVHDQGCAWTRVCISRGLDGKQRPHLTPGTLIQVCDYLNWQLNLPHNDHCKKKNKWVPIHWHFSNACTGHGQEAEMPFRALTKETETQLLSHHHCLPVSALECWSCEPEELNPRTTVWAWASQLLC